MNKEQQRLDVKNAIDAMSTNTLQEASAAISTCVGSIASVASSTTIMSFLPLADEVDLLSLMQYWIEEDKALCAFFARDLFGRAGFI